MKNFTSLSMKILGFSLVVILVTFIDITAQSNIIFAGFALFLSALLLYKSRNDLPIFLASFFIAYCNYSIIVGEYFTEGEIGVPLTQVKTTEIYGSAIRIMVIFMSILALFYQPRKKKLDDYILKRKSNILLYTVFLIILLYSFIFGINRVQLETYSVSITPMYEYSTIIFLLAYYYSGKSFIRKGLLVTLLILFIGQDFYYGGRITSLQLLILATILFLLPFLSYQKVLVGGSIAIVLNSFVAAYRSAHTLEGINLALTIENLREELFVFDTPVFAYYASATHIAAIERVPWSYRIQSFFSFIGSLFVGDTELSNITYFVRNNLFFNYGGGLLFTHFYFWLGMAGTIVIAAITVYLFNNLGSENSDYWKVLSITFLYTVPRWYLYNPISLLRPIILVSVGYFLAKMINQVTRRKKNRRTPINSIDKSYTIESVDFSRGINGN